MGRYSEFTDIELVYLLKDNDYIAYTEIYNRYSGVLYSHAYNKLRNREEAKDILQELFTSIWNNRLVLEFNTSFSGYLYTAIRNRILNHFAKKKNEEKYMVSIQETIKHTQSITDHLIRQKQLAAIIESEIDALPPKMREIFLMSRKLNLSHREIGEKLGIAESTVKKQINNALRVLRARLGLFSFLIFLIKL
ncbi:RNA polymerase sigma factor [Pedobacter sp. L105]|uniref:RNA polymerase sigma factor n=1 Tax=Pedobacter sp. L105 TaxID=1641871 RepID=UPI00131BFC87|nr:RNA polymerase sigma-70 factor [Pedobacter sp. L105]